MSNFTAQFPLNVSPPRAWRPSAREATNSNKNPRAQSSRTAKNPPPSAPASTPQFRPYGAAFPEYCPTSPAREIRITLLSTAFGR